MDSKWNLSDHTDIFAKKFNSVSFFLKTLSVSLRFRKMIVLQHFFVYWLQFNTFRALQSTVFNVVHDFFLRGYILLQYNLSKRAVSNLQFLTMGEWGWSSITALIQRNAEGLSALWLVTGSCVSLLVLCDLGKCNKIA